MVKTRKRNSFGRIKSSLHLHQQIVIRFLEILNTIKLYHWKTHSYATHKATDELHGKIEANVDTFVETMLGIGAARQGAARQGTARQGTARQGAARQGTSSSRINLTNVKSISLKDFNNVNDFKREITGFAHYLVSLDNTSIKSSSDLITIRDELLQDVNQFLYLLTFS
jgi:DNA-binding ferritin-like protein